MPTSWLVLLLVTCVAIAAFAVINGRSGSASSKDPYGSFHLALNEDGGVPEVGTQPQSEWLNMGYWKVRWVVEPYHMPRPTLLCWLRVPQVFLTRANVSGFGSIVLRMKTLGLNLNCETGLALKVINAARIRSGDTVLGNVPSHDTDPPYDH